jgi:mannosyl-3-phosphoglycerate phosphatase family protein
MKRVIFTDLDGTLLDFKDYSYSTVESVLPNLEALGIPVVFCSSKTRVEQEFYRQALHNYHPFITENGSAIFIPQSYFSFTIDQKDESEYLVDQRGNYYVIQLGKTYEYVRSGIQTAKKKVGLELWGYGDLTLDEIEEITGLNRNFAQRAATRDYSETLLKGNKTGQPFEDFKALLLKRGLSCVSGGKFHTVMGAGSDKGKAVQLLTKLYQLEFGSVETIGLGDSANDIPLLAAVDRGYLVQKQGGKWSDTIDNNITKVSRVGPEGWVEVASSIISV